MPPGLSPPDLVGNACPLHPHAHVLGELAGGHLKEGGHVYALAFRRGSRILPPMTNQSRGLPPFHGRDHVLAVEADEARLVGLGSVDEDVGCPVPGQPADGLDVGLGLRADDPARDDLLRR